MRFRNQRQKSHSGSDYTSVFQPGFRRTEVFREHQAGVPPMSSKNKAEINNKET